MTELETKNVREFIYKFPTCTSKNHEYKLEIPLEIPYEECAAELTHRIIYMFDIPIYEEEGLKSALKDFISRNNQSYYDNNSESLIIKASETNFDTEDLIKRWEKIYKEETCDYAERTGPTDEDIFATAYHRLVHSSSLDAMLSIEQSYAMAVRNVCAQRDDQIAELTSQQLNEMENKMHGLHISTTEQEINELAARHFSAQALARGRWSSELHALRGAQRTEYRDWLGTQLGGALSPLSSPTGSYSPPMAPPTTASSNSLEESFTIHLGSQLKHMHNIRILSADVMDLCSTMHTKTGMESGPQRLHTALGLYSGALCGVVLLTDSSIEGHDLAHLANLSTEFHFPPVDDQFENIREQVKDAVIYRKSQPAVNSPGEQSGTKRITKETKNLQTGDIFITRHSNLSQVHVVFHLVADDGSLRSGDINSRHSAILGLRNVLKIASCNDVTTLTIPALLRHEMSEEMTVSWCVRRAELVFKCVKGFMIEAASWGGAELCTLQLLLPPGISEELFSTLANMIPHVFRVANPLVLK